jgi:hypothetical protein
LSWYSLTCSNQIYFILGSGRELFDAKNTTRLLEQIKEYRSRIQELLREDSAELPSDDEIQFVRILEGLLQEDPEKRTSVTDLAKH